MQPEKRRLKQKEKRKIAGRYKNEEENANMKKCSSGFRTDMWEKRSAKIKKKVLDIESRRHEIALKKQAIKKKEAEERRKNGK